MTARHAAPRRQGGHVKTTILLVALALVISVITIAAFIYWGADAAAALGWRAPELTDAQWGRFHEGPRP
jgi:hypothetical protein